MSTSLVLLITVPSYFSQLMNFKNIGAKVPCRWCTMPARRPVGADGQEHGKYYLTTSTPDAPDNPDYGNLPLRIHRQILKDVGDIRACTSAASKELMQTEKGINDQVRSMCERSIRIRFT